MRKPSQTATAPTMSRRGLFKNGARTGLSAAGLSVLAGTSLTSLARAAGDPAADVALINTALALEHEGIAAYQIAAESGLLEPAVLDVGILFQSHHKGHRDELIRAILQLGGEPVEAHAIGAYAEALDAASLGSQADILQLAIRLELGATNAYLGVIPSLNDPNYGHLFARLAADEAMHWTALTQAVGEPLPADAIYFG